MPSVVSPENCESVNNHYVSLSKRITYEFVIIILQRWTSSLVWTVLVVTLSTSFVMGVNIGGPNVYNSVSSSSLYFC